jgi:hypothetical protein
MLNEMPDNPNDYMGKMDFVWWHGVVEDNNDPLKLGRCRVRIYGFHTEDKILIPTKSLPWASVMQPITSAAMSGKGRSPTGILQGTWVVGFFRDGPHAQDPIVMGTVAGFPSPNSDGNYKDPERGFYDPSGLYPLDGYTGEQDTNRLARGEKLDKTILKDRADARIPTIPTALTGHWAEPKSAYGATYPHNHVFESESGHIFEIDDTPTAERLHRHHKSGTFEEIRPDGSRVTKIKGSDYELTIGSKSIMIKGDVLHTNEGKAQLKVGKDFYIEVDGDMRTLVHGNVIMYTKGSLVHRVGGSYTVASDGNMTFVAPRIDLNPEGINSSKVSVGGLDDIEKRRVKFPDPADAAKTKSLKSLGDASTADVVAGNTATQSGTPATLSMLQQQSEGTVSQGALATTSAVSTETATVTTTATSTATAATTQLNGAAAPAIPSEVGGAPLPVGASRLPFGRATVPLILGGVALAGVGVAAALALSSNSGGSKKKVAAVSLPPLPPTSPGLQDSNLVMAGGTGAAQTETGLPGLPTVSLYAVPDEAATLLQGYPGQTGMANTDPTTDLPTVDALPSVPVLAFPAEFAQPVILPDVLDGGSF